MRRLYGYKSRTTAENRAICEQRGRAACFFFKAHVPRGSDFKLTSSIVINLAGCNAIM